MNYILNNDNKDCVKEELKKLVDIGVEFKCQENFRSKHMESFNPEAIELSNDALTISQIIDCFEKDILPYCTNFSSKRFMGFPDAGNSISGMAGSIISDFLQQNLINSTFCAPIATQMEIEVIKVLRQVLGYRTEVMKDIFDVGGIITYGGTGSNVTAMLLARENHRNNTISEGIKNPNEYKVVVPKGIGHYSIRSSLMWIGCGDNIIEVPTNSFKYNLEELKKVVLENKGEIMAVIAYVGDSRTMTIDNLVDVYRVVKEIDPNIWLHADACHGFSLAFSENLRGRIKGLELFDSISTDPHKVLMVPYTLSALLIKDPKKFSMISSSSDLIMEEPFAFGQITPFIGSKSWISLKLWFLLKNYGIKGIGKVIENRCKKADYLGELIRNSNDFILLNDIDINSVMFMYVGDKDKLENSIDELNEINRRIKELIDKEGIYYLHQFSIPDNAGVLENNATIYPLRFMSGNDNLEYKDIKDMLNYVSKIGRKVKVSYD